MLLRTIWALFAMALLAACNPLAAPDEAKQEIASFHKQYNAGQDEKIWKNFGPEFHAVTPRKDWENMLLIVRNTLGKNTSSSQSGINHQATPNGRYLAITMDTQFERGRAMETFTFSGSGENQRLIGYHVNSDEVLRQMMESAAAAQKSVPEPVGQ